MDFAGKRVWIIGASSGIGEALAQHLASKGAAIALSARNRDALTTLKTSLTRKSLVHDHHVIPLNAADPEAVRVAADQVKSLFGEIDTIIFLAALYQPMELTKLDADSVRQMVDVNLIGAFNTVQSVLPILRRQKRGQFALCGSVLGYIGLPHTQPYSATKAAIRNLAQSLRAEMEPYPAIDIRLITPGFVKTPLMEKSPFPTPMVISPQRAAEYIADGLRSRRFEIHFPKRVTYLAKMLSAFPTPLRNLVLRRWYPD